MSEPPAAYRLGPLQERTTWEGEHHIWQVKLDDSTMESISFGRSKIEIEAAEDVIVSLTYYISR